MMLPMIGLIVLVFASAGLGAYLESKGYNESSMHVTFWLLGVVTGAVLGLLILATWAN